MRRLINKIAWAIRDLIVRERDYRRQWAENWENGERVPDGIIRYWR